MYNTNYELFFNQELSCYLEEKKQKIKEEIEKITDNEIISSNIEDWFNYLLTKNKIEELILVDDEDNDELEEIKRKKYNVFYKSDPYYEKEFYEIDGYKLKRKLYYGGDPELLYCAPSSRILTTFDYETITNPKDNIAGYIEIAIEFDANELNNKEDVKSIVNERFDHKFSNYKKMISYINSDIKKYNKNLENIIKVKLEERKNKAKAYESVVNKLGIPLKRNESTNGPKEIVLSKEKPFYKKPEAKNNDVNEYFLKDSDYDHINNVIFKAATSMENHVKSFSKSGEEELRDSLLSSLSTHYDNVVGEGFRAVGKTDIMIEFQGKYAYIGECKIWKGEEVFKKAISQVMSYSTWKDRKITLIIFNKENSDFNLVLDKIESWISQNTSSHIKKEKNMWYCTYYDNEINDVFKIAIMAFNFYLK